MNKFSVILPVYNGGAYVKECVKSILAQTNRDFNLLVLDNNSTDNTLPWIESLKDERILIYRSSVTLGIVESWARIKNIPKNEFITLIGHDDLLLPGYLEEMNHLIIKHPGAGLYQTHFNFIDGKGEYLRTSLSMEVKQYGYEFLASQLTRTIDSMGSGYMMRSRDYDSLGGIPLNYPNLIFADYELWVRLSLISYKATSDKICFNYRLHNSTSKLTNGEQYQAAFEQYILFLGRLRETDENIKKVIIKYGHGFLMYFCESLSHRLLKTPVDLRKMNVNDFIKRCNVYANMLIPEQEFKPLNKIKIRLAQILDSSSLTRKAFLTFKNLTGKLLFTHFMSQLFFHHFFYKAL